MFSGIGSTEMIVLLVIVLLIFGPKNLPRLAQSIGKSVRELKNGLSGLSDDIRESSKEAPPVQNRATTVTPPPADAQPVEHGEKHV